MLLGEVVACGNKGIWNCAEKASILLRYTLYTTKQYLYKYH